MQKRMPQIKKIAQKTFCSTPPGINKQIHRAKNIASAFYKATTKKSQSIFLFGYLHRLAQTAGAPAIPEKSGTGKAPRPARKVLRRP